MNEEENANRQQVEASGPERRVLAIVPDSLRIATRTVRAADGSESQLEVIRGRAIVFGQQSHLLGWFREIIHKNALVGCDMTDVVCLKNHDSNLVLGRTGIPEGQPGWLGLTIEEGGLDFEVIPLATSTARDTLEEVRASAIRGCSFQFDVVPGTSNWETDPETGGDIRTVMKIRKLYDVGPVTFPAYPQTTTDVAKRERDAWKAQQEDLRNEQRDNQESSRDKQAIAAEHDRMKMELEMY